MKKVLSFLMAVIILLAMSACDKDDGQGSDPSESQIVFHRLKKVTVTAYGETIECNVTWDDNICYFESYMDYAKNPIKNCQGVFEPETNTFSLLVKQDDGMTMELPVFVYDDGQHITSVFNEDNPSESWTITYDENGVPLVDGRHTLFEYDPTTKQVKLLYSGGRTDGVDYEEYDLFSLDNNGRFVGVDRLTYKDDGNGNFQLTDTKEDYYKYTYDENGDLIRYEEPYNKFGFVIEYEYYDEPIHHIWEVIIPIHYIDFFEIYKIPFFWYLK